jgi:hypothetical protein
MGINEKSLLAEKAAYKKVKTLLGNPEEFAVPAGFGTGFPDFGFTIYINKKRVDLFFEYKADYTAQMGSMRNWTFDGAEFDAPDADTDTDKQQLLEVMNATPKAIANGKRLLKDFNLYFDTPQKPMYKFKKISSGMLSVEKNLPTRRVRLEHFANNTDNYSIASINDSTLGQKVLDHYHKKFHANLNSDADHSIMFMMLDDTIWFLEETGNLTYPEKKMVSDLFGATQITVLRELVAKLEVRIQPRGLKDKSKPTSIDVMANFRLSRKPAGGIKV